MAQKVILWDWDGTLVDSINTLHQVYNQTRGHFGMDEWTLEEAKTNIALSGREVFPRMFGENAAEAEALFYKTYAELAPKNVQAKEGRAAMLEETCSKGVTHLLISNKRGDILRAECKALGWEKYFKAIIGANDAREDKPSPAPIALAYEQANLETSPEHYYIGDAPLDGQTAKAAKIKSLLLAEETHGHDYLAPHGDEIMTYQNFRAWLLNL